jgi:probable DNA repair protein
MKSSAELPRQIQQALERGWTVLTANQRAARTLHHGYDLDQCARGLTHWEPPAILAWDAWLASLWHRLLLDGHASELLLNSTQEHTLWRAIIAADPVNASLRPIDSLAELAAEAWLLLHAYCGRRRLQASVVNADTRAFARWANEFDRRAARAQLLTQAQLPEALRAAFTEGRFTATQPAQAGLLLVGFDSMKPAHTALLDAIHATGTPIEEHSPKIPGTGSGAPSIAVSSQWVGSTDREPDAIPNLTLVSAPDERAELTACARWLRARLTQQPDARIAVIVPAIETVRAQIDRVFRQTLAPELNQIAAPANSGPYEFSLGVPLAHTLMVAAALDILRWATGPLALDRVSALLLSPHFAASNSESGSECTSPAPSDLLTRAEFDAFVLRKQHLLQPEITLDALCTLVAESRHVSNLTNLLKRLSALRPLFLRRDLLTAQQTHADWAATFHDLLDAAGWAAPGRDSSTEFQVRRKWQSALDELATLDFDSAFDSRSDGTRVPFAAALDALDRIATQTLFAPESRHAPIQIMGPLESAGSSFDALWFLGSSDLAWPSNPSPNPLLPWLLQRELAMPGADPAQDTTHARRITERIAASAPTVFFSYAHQSSEGHQRPSPVVTGLAAADVALELRTTNEIAPPEPTPAPIQLEPLSDDAPIPPPPDRVLHGGASILQSQAACGFRAFAEKRLFSSALDTASLGLDPRQRGSIVHAVLERFWAEVESQSALQLLTPEEREARLTHCIRVTLDRQYPNPAPGWPRAYLLTERQRLLKLLGPWLDFEANSRAPFTVKSREETLRDVQIGPLRLDIRVDRVDRIDLTQLPPESVEDESVDDQPDDNEPKDEKLAGEIILDYKTGPASPADWLGDRPDAPQLPLYAVVSAAANKSAAANNEDAPHLAAVAFASVRPGKDLGLHGYQSRDGVLHNAAKLKAESLQAQVDEWREVLTALAEDFYSGTARVDPKQYPQTCAHCEQRLLCRLDPATLDVNSLDEDSAAGSDSNLSGSFDSASEEAARG